MAISVSKHTRGDLQMFCPINSQHRTIFNLQSYKMEKNVKSSNWKGWNQRTIGVFSLKTTVTINQLAKYLHMLIKLSINRLITLAFNISYNPTYFLMMKRVT